MLRQIHLIPRRIVSSGLDETPVTGALVTFDGFAPGEWHIELWDTREDRVTNSRNHAVEGDGRIESALPGWRYRTNDGPVSSGCGA